MSGKVRIHRAKWLFPIISPPVEDGAVAVRNGIIEKVGRFKELRGMGGDISDHGEGVIWPALVNAHTHLELSAMGGRVSGERGFASWVRELIELRGKLLKEDVEKAVHEALSEMYSQGTGLAADTGNSLLAHDIGRGQQNIDIEFFFEFLGFNREKTEAARILLDEMVFYLEREPHFHLAAHAPYSVSAALLDELKRRSKENGKMLSMHLGETLEEKDFLKNSSGDLKELLKDRSAWDSEFKPLEEEPVFYLKSLGILDKATICVHLVNLTEKELTALAESGAKICLCPRSNVFLGVGFPRIERMLELNMRPALGTDSLASNCSLSILDEMVAVATYAPSVPLEKILEMATINGARALGRQDFGSISPGVKAKMFFVPLKAESAGQALEKILSGNDSISVSWI